MSTTKYKFSEWSSRNRAPGLWGSPTNIIGASAEDTEENVFLATQGPSHGMSPWEAWDWYCEETQEKVGFLKALTLTRGFKKWKRKEETLEGFKAFQREEVSRAIQKMQAGSSSQTSLFDSAIGGNTTGTISIKLDDNTTTPSYSPTYSGESSTWVDWTYSGKHV